MKRLVSSLIVLILAIGIFGLIDVSKAFAVNSMEISSAIRLKELDVLMGTSQGFKLDDKATRLEGLVLLIRLLGKEKDTKYYSDVRCKFIDVPQWGIKYVNYAYQNNLTKGISDTLFGSESIITSTEYISFLLRALGYQDVGGDFGLDKATEKSDSLGILKSVESPVYNTSGLTRGGLALLSSYALDTKMKTGNATLGAALELSASPDNAAGFSVTESGARGNGKTDDTAAIQKALDEHNDVFLPEGVYMINGSIGLRPRSNQTIRLSEHAVLKLIPNASDSSYVFQISDLSNLVIQGGTIVGNRDSHTANNGEGSAGVNIQSNNRQILIKNMKIKDFWDSGISIGGEIASENIKMDSVICSNNKKQGMSIANAKNLEVENCLMENSNGSVNELGIYVGAKTGGMVEKLSILNTWLMNNKGDGIGINGTKGKVSGVSIINCLSDYNACGISIRIASNIIVKNSKFSHSLTDGVDLVRDVVGADFSDVISTENGYKGVSMVVTEQKVGTRDINFDNCTFSNNSLRASGDRDGVRIDNYDSSKMLENIKFTACRFIDDQKVPKQRYGLTVGFGTGMKNIIVETSCVFKGNVVNDMLNNRLISIITPVDSDANLNIKAAGAIGDGKTDDTAAIQRALKASNSIVIPKGIYMINTNPGLKVKSNQSIVFEKGATFKAIPNSEDFYTIIDVSGVRNVSITGGLFIGDRYSHMSKSGEWGTGLNIGSNSQNITVISSRFEKFWGDGVYIGGKSPIENINIQDVVCDNNRRSGISITTVKTMMISNCTFSNSNGTAPQTGISIETEIPDPCEDIMISGTKCLNNKGVGINLLGVVGIVKNIRVFDTESRGNSLGIYMERCQEITIRSSSFSENKSYGMELPRDVVNGSFSDMVISKNNSTGVALITTDQRYGLENLIFNKCTFLNNGFSKPNEKDGVRIDSYDLSGIIKNVKFYSCSFIDNQVLPTQRYGISMRTNGKVSGLLIDGKCTFRGNKTANMLKT